MWVVLKYDKKKFHLLKEDFKKKIGDDYVIYRPQVLVQKYKNNQVINKKLDIYFYDWEIKKVLDLCHKIYNEGQAETLEMLKFHKEVKELNQISKRLVRDELPKMKQILKESK